MGEVVLAVDRRMVGRLVDGRWFACYTYGREVEVWYMTFFVAKDLEALFHPPSVLHATFLKDVRGVLDELVQHCAAIKIQATFRGWTWRLRVLANPGTPVGHRWLLKQAQAACSGK